MTISPLLTTLGNLDKYTMCYTFEENIKQIDCEIGNVFVEMETLDFVIDVIKEKWEKIVGITKL